MFLCISILSELWQLAYCTAGNSWCSILECIICKLGNKHMYSVVVLQVRIIIIAKLKRNTKTRQDSWGRNKRNLLHVQLFQSKWFYFSVMWTGNNLLATDHQQCGKGHFVMWAIILLCIFKTLRMSLGDGWLFPSVCVYCLMVETISYMCIN